MEKTMPIEDARNQLLVELLKGLEGYVGVDFDRKTNNIKKIMAEFANQQPNTVVQEYAINLWVDTFRKLPISTKTQFEQAIKFADRVVDAFTSRFAKEANSTDSIPPSIEETDASSPE